MNPDNFPQRPGRKAGKRRDTALGPSDRSDTPSDRPGEPGTDTDAGADRVVSSQEAGLGGGLDQAEEAQQGKSDEEIAKERDLEAELIKTPPPRKK